MEKITLEEIQIIIKEVHREDPIGIKIAVEKMIDDRTQILRDALERIVVQFESLALTFQSLGQWDSYSRSIRCRDSAADALLRAGKGESVVKDSLTAQPDPKQE